MERIKIKPRTDWRVALEDVGFSWHTLDDGTPYWDESVYYRFTADEVDVLEAATDELHSLSFDCVDYIIKQRHLPLLGYDSATCALIERSWANRSNEPTFYGRFDLAYDGKSPPKLLEYNGDTPTTLVVTCTAQWYWLQAVFPEADQFNSIHEKLREGLRRFVYLLRARVRQSWDPEPTLHLTSVTPSAEDEGTLAYLASVAAEATLPTKLIGLTDIGLYTPTNTHDPEDYACFVDLDEQRIDNLFKLAPWEWLLNDPFGANLRQLVADERVRVIEPAWKMVLSNKRFLVSMWERYPYHELLLPASMSANDIEGDRVRKPVLGREGANVSILRADGSVIEQVGGTYGDGEFIYQQRAPLFQAEGQTAVLGSWIIDGKSAGVGVRESSSLITGSGSRFVPHLFDRRT